MFLYPQRFDLQLVNLARETRDDFRRTVIRLGANAPPGSLSSGNLPRHARCVAGYPQDSWWRNRPAATGKRPEDEESISSAQADSHGIPPNPDSRRSLAAASPAGLKGCHCPLSIRKVFRNVKLNALEWPDEGYNLFD